MTHYLVQRRLRRRRFRNYLISSGSTGRQPSRARFQLSIHRHLLRRRRRLRRLPFSAVPAWMVFKAVRVRRTFYTQLLFEGRLVYQLSSGQINPRHRQRTWPILRLVKMTLARLTRFVSRHPFHRRRKIELARKYRHPFYPIPPLGPNPTPRQREFHFRRTRLKRRLPLRGRRVMQRVRSLHHRLTSWGHKSDIRLRHPVRKRLAFIFDRYQPHRVWFAITKVVRDWLRKHRRTNVKVRYFFRSRTPHNGQRGRKKRRV